MNPKIDQYLAEGCGRCSLVNTPECKVHQWMRELSLLRNIVLSCNLKEERKWGIPCYTHNGKNVLTIAAFKNHCALSFFKGALLKDQEKLLYKPGENSQAVRFFKFTSPEQVQQTESKIRAYIFEALDIEDAGLKIAFRKNPEPMPEELIQIFEEDPLFRDAFDALTPGRQRGYILHFSQPKQAKTRISRIEKWLPKIMNGEGMHDAYKAGKK